MLINIQIPLNGLSKNNGLSQNISKYSYINVIIRQNPEIHIARLISHNIKTTVSSQNQRQV